MISPGRAPLLLTAKLLWSAGCQSWVATIVEKCGITRLTTAIVSSPRATASAPPGQKSYWRSTRISARIAVSLIHATGAEHSPLQLQLDISRRAVGIEREGPGDLELAVAALD